MWSSTRKSSQEFTERRTVSSKKNFDKRRVDASSEDSAAILQELNALIELETARRNEQA